MQSNTQRSCAKQSDPGNGGPVRAEPLRCERTAPSERPAGMTTKRCDGNIYTKHRDLTAIGAGEQRWPRATRSGFTMIEMLTVLAVMIILMALLLTGVSRAKQRALMRRAVADCRQIMTANQSFFSYYGIWPIVGTNDLTATNTHTVFAAYLKMMGGFSPGSSVLDPKVLLLARTSSPGNPGDANVKRIKFLEYDMSELNTNGDMVDPWGNPYLMRFDMSETNAIAHPFKPGQLIRAGVIVWSAGPDGQMSTNTPFNDALNKDNPTSWE